MYRDRKQICGRQELREGENGKQLLNEYRGLFWDDKKKV